VVGKRRCGKKIGREEGGGGKKKEAGLKKRWEGRLGITKGCEGKKNCRKEE